MGLVQTGSLVLPAVRQVGAGSAFRGRPRYWRPRMLRGVWQGAHPPPGLCLAFYLFSMDDLWCQHEAELLDLVSLFILQCPVEDVIPGATGGCGVWVMTVCFSLSVTSLAYEQAAASAVQDLPLTSTSALRFMFSLVSGVGGLGYVALACQLCTRGPTLVHKMTLSESWVLFMFGRSHTVYLPVIRQIGCVSP